MGYKFGPIGEGKHNNIHFRLTVTHKKIKILECRIIAFTNTEKAYILNLKLNAFPMKFLNRVELIKSINENLNRFDFKLIELDKEDFNNTEELLEYLK